MTRARDLSNSSISNPTIIDAKGDLIAGTTADTSAVLAVGTDGQVLTAASGQTTGLQWAAANDTTKIPLSTVTTAGDLIVGTGSSTVGRLGIGANGTYLTSNGSTASWGTISGGGMTVISSGNLPTGTTTLSVSGIPSSYVDLAIYIYNPSAVSANSAIWMRVNNISTASYSYQSTTSNATAFSVTSNNSSYQFSGSSSTPNFSTSTTNYGEIVCRIANYSVANTIKYIDSFGSSGYNSYNFTKNYGVCSASGAVTAVIDRIDLICSSNYTGGTYAIYGVK